MQLHPVEVCDLISLTNSVGAFQYSPRLTLEYYAILGKLVDDQTLSPSEWSFLRHSVKSIRRGGSVPLGIPREMRYPCQL